MNSASVSGTPPPRPAPPVSAAWDEVRPWRVHMRRALIGARLALPREERQALGARARQHLLERVELSLYPTLGLYWPVRGEIDLLELAAAHLTAGGRIGLPVVVSPAAPIEFWSWRPEMPMSRGVWNIPIPASRELLQPDACIVPLVGFDARGYRLGYGGGYYDRTLAAAARRPYCVGLGYASTALPSIFPQPHDIPMNTIVTDAAP